MKAKPFLHDIYEHVTFEVSPAGFLTHEVPHIEAAAELSESSPTPRSAMEEAQNGASELKQL